jgi:hypothetical protein
MLSHNEKTAPQALEIWMVVQGGPTRGIWWSKDTVDSKTIGTVPVEGHTDSGFKYILQYISYPYNHTLLVVVLRTSSTS